MTGCRNPSVVGPDIRPLARRRQSIDATRRGGCALPGFRVLALQAKETAHTVMPERRWDVNAAHRRSTHP